MRTFEIRLDDAVARIKVLEETKPIPASPDTELEKRIQDMERMIANMTFTKQGRVVVLIGNLELFRVEEIPAKHVATMLKRFESPTSHPNIHEGLFAFLDCFRYAS